MIPSSSKESSSSFIKTYCTLYNLQYVFLSTLFLSDYIIIQSPGWIIKTLVGIALVSSLFLPFIRRFTKPALPIFAWLITFYACQFIPTSYRPSHIFVNILPTLERILYGASLSEIISKHTHPILDVLAWLPYGVIHFSLPFILAFLLFIFGPPGAANIFGQAFGYMNIAGVLTQLLFPNASPWYEMSYGSAPADYSIPGEPGGLARIDDILGLKLYGSTFGGSPLVFGAFPSLHSGSATIEMLFVTYLCPKLWPLSIGYTMWLWWSTMYLTHHYLIDLVGGSIYAFLTFFVARQYLPKVDPKKPNRLAYFIGMPNTSISNFIRSIEYSMCFSNTHYVKVDNNYEDIEQQILYEEKEYDLVHGTTTMDGQPQDIYVLMEPDMEKRHQRRLHHYQRHRKNGSLAPIRMRRIDSNERSLDDDDATSSSWYAPALVSSHTSPTSSEPNSPITPYTPDPDGISWKR
ncbi:uncharacterized protein BX664DRAFT_283751 [Halteromyces radiatus]|uniref:uncharacterized protein n=1 Tax=Halteromyces radiatus TaxID=101107 RepID=UPI00221FEBED|nr:uncharacterized protein BX664DRAFT_283751 [Halteromyces radiatus]KAI8084883.1 hypothetical protein BX664DRAFT_283751 [Halteromyces radiatus]